MTPAEFKTWMKTMKFSVRKAATALGCSPAAVQDMATGKSRDTGKPVTIDRRTALACSAIHKGLDPWPPHGQHGKQDGE